MKLNRDEIHEKIKTRTYFVLPDGRTTICQLELENGFTINGISSVLDGNDFNLLMGRQFAYQDAVRQIWPLEAYLLASKYYVMRTTSGKPNKSKEPTKTLKKPHWTQTPEGKKIMANRKPRGQKK